MSNHPKKKTTTPPPAAKTPQKKTSFLPLAAVAAVAICAAVVFLTNGKESVNENSDTGRENGGAAVIASGESLKILTSDVTTDVSFYPVEVGGTDMEVIAVRDSAGTIRTAFNTCQVCYDSGRSIMFSPVITGLPKLRQPFLNGSGRDRIRWLQPLADLR